MGYSFQFFMPLTHAGYLYYPGLLLALPPPKLPSDCNSSHYRQLFSDAGFGHMTCFGNVDSGNVTDLGQDHKRHPVFLLGLYSWALF